MPKFVQYVITYTAKLWSSPKDFEIRTITTLAMHAASREKAEQWAEDMVPAVAKMWPFPFDNNAPEPITPDEITAAVTTVDEYLQAMEDRATEAEKTRDAMPPDPEEDE